MGKGLRMEELLEVLEGKLFELKDRRAIKD